MPDENPDPKLVLGPLLRYVAETEATVWVETSAPCEVEILGHREPTFRVEEHHYALVRIEGLEPASRYEYEVRLDGERAWPRARLGAAAERDPHRSTATSRSTSASAPAASPLPHEAPFTEPKDEPRRRPRVRRPLGAGQADGRAASASEWPEQLFLLGDQVYVDEGSPQTREKIRERRGTDDAARRGGDRLRGVHLALPARAGASR